MVSTLNHTTFNLIMSHLCKSLVLPVSEMKTIPMLKLIRIENESGDVQSDSKFKKLDRPGVVAHAYNPSTLGSGGSWIS